MLRQHRERIINASITMSVVMLTATPSWAAAGLEGLTAKIQQFNSALITVGGALSLTGFIWGVAALVLGMAGLARAVTCILGGLAIAGAPQIVGFFTGGM